MIKICPILVSLLHHLWPLVVQMVHIITCIRTLQWFCACYLFSWCILPSQLLEWEPVDKAALKADLQRVLDKGITSLAVVLMHSYMWVNNPLSLLPPPSPLCYLYPPPSFLCNVPFSVSSLLLLTHIHVLFLSLSYNDWNLVLVLRDQDIQIFCISFLNWIELKFIVCKR